MLWSDDGRSALQNHRFSDPRHPHKSAVRFPGIQRDPAITAIPLCSFVPFVVKGFCFSDPQRDKPSFARPWPFRSMT